MNQPKQPNRIDRLGDSIHCQYPTCTAFYVPLKHVLSLLSQGPTSPKNHTSIRLHFHFFISAHFYYSPVRFFCLFHVFFVFFFSMFGEFCSQVSRCLSCCSLRSRSMYVSLYCRRKASIRNYGCTGLMAIKVESGFT